MEDLSQAARGGGKLFAFISEVSRLSLDAIHALRFLKDSSYAARTENPHNKKEEAANA